MELRNTHSSSTWCMRRCCQLPVLCNTVPTPAIVTYVVPHVSTHSLISDNTYYSLKPCFSVYFSSWNPTKSTELTEEPLPVHSKSNIKWNTSICLSFMCIVCKKSKANLKLADMLIVSPDTSTLYGEFCWLTGLLNQEAAVVWVLSLTE